ncbi:hypothetical protein [Streptomyces sp. NPDC056663]|uniref:TetR/AcrR family transcriptional regulator n=1 Tax=Streptomyces sp. NPDC056663 TaxID=3345899 RepID=UPI00367EB9A1
MDRPDVPLLLGGRVDPPRAGRRLPDQPEEKATAKAFCDQIEAAFASCLGRIAPEETERTPAFTALVSAQLAGLVMLRYVLAVEPLASLDFEDLMEWLAPAIEVHFDRRPQE